MLPTTFFPECQKIPVCPEPWIFRSSRPSSLFTTPTLVPLPAALSFLLYIFPGPSRPGQRFLY